METIKINLHKPDAEAVALIVDYLRRGQVVVLPTDTVYGLSCRADNALAVNKIFRMKRREKTKPLICLVGSLGMAKRYCKISHAQEAYLKNKWPGPFTLVLEKKLSAPRLYAAAGDSLALRLPNNKFMLTILKRLKTPVVSTSLNLSGDKKSVPLAGLSRYFHNNEPDMVVDSGPWPKRKPSKIIDIRDLINIKIKRN